MITNQTKGLVAIRVTRDESVTSTANPMVTDCLSELLPRMTSRWSPSETLFDTLCLAVDAPTPFVVSVPSLVGFGYHHVSTGE